MVLEASELGQLVDSRKGLLDRRIFDDPEVYQLELERVFGRSWLMLGHECQIPNPGDFVSTYMGEDPIILTRDSGGKIHALLNLCKHRGNRVCRADKGNAGSFMCTYHGWTYANDGRLIGVPGLKDAYFGELEIEKLGLAEVAQLDTYKGLIFATFDPEAPSLLDYLGDMAWYLDLILDRREGGTELIGGIHKWVMDCNWKLAVDNFIGDMSHASVTHGSAMSLGATPGGGPRRRPTDLLGWRGYQVSPGNGHGLGTRWLEEGEMTPEMYASDIFAYNQEHLAELEQRLGPVRAKRLNPIHASVFPNMSFLFSSTIRVWHPRGPTKTEVWAYTFMDRDAPAEVKKARRLAYMRTFGPSGTWEEDDMDNWAQTTAAGRGWASRRFDVNVQMGVGHEHYHEDLPGRVGDLFSEINQRAVYERWQEMIAAESWSQITISPRTTTTE